MKIKSKKSSKDNIVISIEEHACRIQHFILGETGLVQAEFNQFEYKNLDDLADKFENWTKQYPCKTKNCRWLLTREKYQTYPIDPPKVQPKEVDEAIKWQIKDLLELPVNDVLVRHYRPRQPDNQQIQLIAVVVSKVLVEKLIEITRQSGMQLDSIEIEELTVGQAIDKYLVESKIVGFIDEDKNGLIFNFYSGRELAFSRHKKGKFLPNSDANAFSLEDDKNSLEEAFLLETQRTLDYVVTQIFRRPVDSIILHQSSAKDNYLADIIKQVTEVEVVLISAEVEQQNPEFALPTLVETGTALRADS